MAKENRGLYDLKRKRVAKRNPAMTTNISKHTIWRKTKTLEEQSGVVRITFADESQIEGLYIYVVGGRFFGVDPGNGKVRWIDSSEEKIEKVEFLGYSYLLWKITYLESQIRKKDKKLERAKKALL